MVTTAQRVDFNTKHLTDKQGNRWSSEGREWVVDEFYRALDGWKAWPFDAAQLCDECAGRIGSIVDSSDALDDTHDHEPGCRGLQAHKIVGLLLPLERRAGKTFNAAGYALPEIFKGRNRRVSYLASSGDQSEDVVAQNFVGPVERSPALKGRARIYEDRIEVPSTKSRLKWLAHSVAAVTGKGESLILIDECRNVSARIAALLIPSAYDEHGWECVKCGFKLPMKAGEKPASRRCPQCRDRIEEYSGRLIFMSNQGMLTGDEELDWFAALLEKLEKNPDPRWHVFNPSEGTQLNPAVEAAGVKSAMVEVLGDVRGIGKWVQQESDNRFREKGEPVLSSAVIEACMDRSLQYVSSSSAPSVGFLDTSISVDMTNLVVLAQDLERNAGARNPWGWLRLERADVWDPKQQAGGQINEDVMIPVIDDLMLRFPALIKLLVDCRGGKPKWVQALLDHCSRRPYARRVEEFSTRGDRERDIGWLAMHEHYTGRTLVLPWDPRITKEMAGLSWKRRPDGTITVVDKNRKARHKELTESMAIARWKITEYIGQTHLDIGDVNNEGRGRGFRLPRGEDPDAVVRAAFGGVGEPSLRGIRDTEKGGGWF